MSLTPDSPGRGWHRIHPPPRIARPRLAVPLRIDPEGRLGPTPGAARGRKWRRTSPGLFLPADAAFDQPGQRILEAAHRAGADNRVTGWASLHLAGARWFEGVGTHGETLPVQLRIGPDRRMVDRPGLLFDRRRILEGETVIRHGVPCLNVHRSLFDEVVRRGELRSGVAAIDMVFHAELTTPDRFRAWLDTVSRTPGLPLVRRTLALSAEGAESPPEVALRLLWRFEAALPAPLCNVPVHDQTGRFLGRPDLICPELGIAGEYDGPHHFTKRARSRDITREAGFRNVGSKW